MTASVVNQPIEFEHLGVSNIVLEHGHIETRYLTLISTAIAYALLIKNQ